jgi:hypothetical protein
MAHTVFQAQAAQIEILQNELKSLKAQLVNLKGKLSQLAIYAQPIQGSRSWERPFRSFYGLSHDAMVGEYVLSSHTILVSQQNFLLFFALPTLQHKRLVWHPELLPLGK